MKRLILLSLSTFLITLILQFPSPIAHKFLPDFLINAQSLSPDEAVLRQILAHKERRPITYLKIVENYAFVIVSDDYTGGAAVYKKTSQGWQVVVESGGSFSVNDLEKYGVPPGIAHELVPTNSVAQSKFQKILPEFQSPIPELTKTQVPVLLPTRVPVETIEPNPGVELPASVPLKEGHFVTFFPYPNEISPTRYSISLDLIPDCMGAGACLFGEVAGEKITKRTPKIPEEFTVSQEMWRDPLFRNIPKSDKPPSQVQLFRGIKGYFAPFFCPTRCSNAKIIWDMNGYRYQVGIKAASKEMVVEMANSAIKNQP